jgi:hypothetical protein
MLPKIGLSTVRTFSPLGINLELSHVALFIVLPLFHVLPYFRTLKLSSLHLVIFRQPYLTHMKFDFLNF